MRQEDIDRLSLEGATIALDLLEKEISKMKLDGKTGDEMEVCIAFIACAMLASMLLKNGKQLDSELLDSYRSITLNFAQQLRINSDICGLPN